MSNMESYVEEGRLTNKQIVRLAAAISSRDMETIALGYLGVEDETCVSLRVECSGTEAFNRALIRRWAYQHPGELQVKRLAAVLYEAAEDEAYVKPEKVQQILGVTRAEAAALSHPTAQPTEKELVSAVRQLRQQMLDVVTPEMAPWAKKYTPKMEDVKVKFKITKHGQSQRQSSSADYKELFGETKAGNSELWSEGRLEDKLLGAYARKGSGTRGPGMKLLVKGKTGSGKSTLAKKMAHDWARGMFTAFSMVFCVFLKLLNPDETIENYIIRQVKWKDLNLRQEKLKFILETFGHECLLILDGMEDVAGEEHEDLQKIVTDQMFSSCNILLTSEPNKTTDQLERHFEVVCEIPGFETTADNFVSRVMEDQEKIQAILSCNPVTISRFGKSEERNPMLLMFLCVLVDNDEIDLGRRRVTLSEIYTRLVQILFKKFTPSALLNVMRCVGKRALDSLQPQTMFMRKDRELGPEEVDALHHGLLIRHPNSAVTLPHITLQVFLAALYFIQMLSDGASVESIFDFDCKEPVFMINSFLLYFCLQLLSKQEYFPCQNQDRAYHEFQNYILDGINLIQLDLRDFSSLHPALISLAHEENDERAVEFLTEILSMCSKTKILYLSREYPVEQILSAMQPVFQNLVLIHLTDDGESLKAEHLRSLDSSFLTIILQSEKYADHLLECVNKSERPFSLEYWGNHKSKPVVDLSKLTKKGICRLLIHQTAMPCMVVAQREIGHCPDLTHISITARLSHPDGLMTELCTAVSEGKFPSVTHLRFSVTGCEMKGKLLILLNKKWPTVTHLDLGSCDLNVEDLQCLSAIRLGKTGGSLIPQLTSLFLKIPGLEERHMNVVGSASPNTTTTFPKEVALSGHPWSKLTTLKIHEDELSHTPLVTTALLNGKLPSLTELMLLQSKDESDVILRELLTSEHLTSLRRLTITKETSSSPETVEVKNLAEYKVIRELNHLDLSWHRFSLSLCNVIYRGCPSLESLILSNCQLYPQDLRSLAQANVEGWLPALKHLDIAFNESVASLEFLFDFESKWGNLKTLKVQRDEEFSDDKHDDGETTDNDFRCLCGAVESHCLGSLQELSVSVATSGYFPTACQARWRHLRKLEMW